MSFWKDLVPAIHFSTLRGWLYKQDPTTLFPSWRKRFFVQEGDKLYWYKSSDHLEHLGVASLREVVSVDQRDPAKTGSELWKIEIKFNTKSLYLRCETEEEMNYWITGLRNCVHFFQEDWSTSIDDDDSPTKAEEDESHTNTVYQRDSISPHNSPLTGTQVSQIKSKSHSNSIYSIQPTNSKFVSFPATTSLFPEEEKKSMEVSRPSQRDFLKPKLSSWPTLSDEKNFIPKIPTLKAGFPKEEIPKLPYMETQVGPSSSKSPHLIRFSSTGLIIQRPSDISEFPTQPKTPQNDEKTIDPELKIKQLEELKEKQTKTITSLLEIIKKNKIEQRKLEKIVLGFDNKKKSIEFVVGNKRRTN